MYVCLFFSKDEPVTTKGPDASKIDKLTAESGQAIGTKVTDFGAAALHFDVCITY